MTLLSLSGIHRDFRSGGRTARALDGVDINLDRGEIVGLVGESGCGKTTLARIAVGLDHPNAGQVTFDGAPIVDQSGRVAAAARRRIQLVFQEPMASFNPRRTIGQSILMPLKAHGLKRGNGRSQATSLLEMVGLDPTLIARRPHMLSGGQLQRAAIARALALEPEILICDEPVASLDVSVRAQVLNLLIDLWRERDLGILFVSHDLGVVRRIADRVAVMYLGRIVETGANAAVWSAPSHPYTRALAASVPAGADGWRTGAGRVRLAGEPPSPFDVPAGCRFHPRCPIADAACTVDDPRLRRITPDITAACHHAP